MTTPRPLLCPFCKKFDWSVLRAADTGGFALECNSCRARVLLGVPRDVPTLAPPVS